MPHVNIELARLAAERTPAELTMVAAAAVSPFSIVILLSWVWERGILMPTIIMNPRRLPDLIGWGEEEIPPDLRFSLIRPAEWEHEGSLRGHFLDCEVHVHPLIARNEVIVFSDPQPDGKPISSKVVIV